MVSMYLGILTNWLALRCETIFTPLMELSVRNQILAASRKVFLSDGFVGARMQTIADEAGISKALLHYHFKNKESLYQEVIQFALAQLQPILDSFLTSQISPKIQITSCVQDIWDLHQKQPELIQFIILEAKNNFSGFQIHTDIIKTTENQEVNLPNQQLFFEVFCVTVGLLLVQESTKSIFPQLTGSIKLTLPELTDAVVNFAYPLYFKRFFEQ